MALPAWPDGERLLGLLDAVYARESSESRWLQGVARAAAQALRAECGVHAYFIDDPQGEIALRAPIYEAGTQPWATRWRSDWWEPFMVGLDRASLRWMHGFGACSFATDLWEASRLRIPVLAEYLSQMAATRWGATHRRYLQQGAAPAGESPIYPDSFNLFGFDGQGGACALLVNLPEARRIRLRPRDVVFWERVTGHLGAGLRLLRAAEQGATRLDDAEAIFDGQLRAVHASGPASSSASRAGLARVARLFDEARARRVEGREKLELWRALNQGRWSVLEEFDSDGRRFIVARPNAPRPDPQQGLTERESQVAALLVAGHSNKLIAYELGVSSSTVSTHVTAIAAKLGTKTRIQLIQALRARGTA